MGIVKRGKVTEEKVEVRERRRRTKEEKLIAKGFVPEPMKKVDAKVYDTLYDTDDKIPENWDAPMLTERNPATSIEVWNRLAEKNRVSLKKKVFGDISYGEFQEAVFHSGGFETNIARRLGISSWYVKQVFAKYKPLKQLFMEVRESVIDEVEVHMLDRIRSGAKEAVPLMIFMLKCLGKERGYIERENVVAKKSSVRMKIVPVKDNGKVVEFKKRKAG